MFLRNQSTKKERIFNRNNILYVLLIIAVLFLFFNPNGIVALMKNQRVTIKLEYEIKELNKKAQELKNQIAIISDSLITKNRLKEIMKEKGIVSPGESWYKIEEKSPPMK